MNSRSKTNGPVDSKADGRVRLIRSVRRGAEKRAKKASDDELWFDKAAFLLEEYERTVEAASGANLTVELGVRRLRTESESKNEEILRREAGAGVETIEVKRRADGYAEVKIDDAEPFTLTPGLADLIIVLSADHPWKPADGLVGWKSYDGVASSLNKKGCTPMVRQALTERIRKLREVLRKAGLNPFLVITSRGKGVRFALRSRRNSAEVAQDEMEGQGSRFDGRGEA